MPLYEFECESCHERFERIQKFSDPLPEKCPICGRGPVKKRLSTPAIQFKGSGFYITDYAKKPESSTTETGKKTEAGTGESKPASGASSESKETSKSSSASESTTTSKESAGKKPPAEKKT